MRLVLATGIYPPDIGGPATYCRALAEKFHRSGVRVTVVAYGDERQVISDMRHQTSDSDLVSHVSSPWRVISVSKAGGPLLRWLRYAQALKQHACDADVVIAFSSVSCGVPLWLSRVQKPKKILRLGGDFFWERYTDRGGKLCLREWYEKRFHRFMYAFIRLFVFRLLKVFDHIVFSTRFQEKIYEEHYKQLPPHFVIENALPDRRIQTVARTPHRPFRLLFMGRFVGFKNLTALVRAISNERETNETTLTFVGEGPMQGMLTSLVHSLHLEKQVTFLPPVHGEKKREMLATHDLLILPSLTEISPNVALEARACGLPVLLTQETGLSASLTQGMVVRDLLTVEEVHIALQEVQAQYSQIATEAAQDGRTRTWENVAEDFRQLFSSL